MREDEKRGHSFRKPNIASDVKDLAECERWRGQLVRQMQGKIAQIQNGMLGEHKIRELNDEINRLMREKSNWERQIMSLGGAAHHSSVPLTDADGKVVVGPNGYVYFGAARNLPGVRDLLEKKQVEIKKRTKADLYEAIDCDYYGFRDDDDGLLLRLEKEADSRMTKILPNHAETLNDPEPANKVYVPISSDEDIKLMLLERKKQALLEQLDKMHE